jgi:transcriptional regulator with XRE-family HTH domain
MFVAPFQTGVVSMNKEQIKLVREQNNLSRKDLATILKCNMKRVVDFEKGLAIIAVEEQQVLVEKFNLPEDFFDHISEDDDDLIDDSDYDQVIGRNVKFYREKHGMTQQMLAEEVGFSSGSSLSAVERGIKPIGKKKLIKLADIFGIHVSDLFSKQILSDTDNDAKLINDFMFLVRSKKQASVMGAIKSLVTAGCEELRGM